MTIKELLNLFNNPFALISVYDKHNNLLYCLQKNSFFTRDIDGKILFWKALNDNIIIHALEVHEIV